MQSRFPIGRTEPISYRDENSGGKHFPSARGSHTRKLSPISSVNTETRRNLPLEYLLPRQLPLPSEQAIPIGYWDPRILEEHHAHGGLPIVLVMWPNDLKTFWEAQAASVVLAARDAARNRDESHTSLRGAQSLESMLPLSGDSYVTQDDPRVPEDIFVRLARSGVLRARKVGRKWVARWCDVQEALRPSEPPDPPSDSVDVEELLLAELGLERNQ